MTEDRTRVALVRIRDLLAALSENADQAVRDYDAAVEKAEREQARERRAALAATRLRSVI